MPDAEFPVVIVGGSLVGLSTAVFLGAQGIPALVVERHPGTAIHPRAALVSQRTVELFRALGLQPEIEGGRGASSSRTARSCRSSRSAARSSTWYFRSINEGVEALSPAPRLFVTQIGLEPILRRHAEAAGARLEYETEAFGLEQDDDGVTVRLRERAAAASAPCAPATWSRPTARRARCATCSASARADTARSPTASRSTSAPTSTR